MKRKMKLLLACALSLAPLGCAPVLDAQSALITQARRGVALATTAQEQILHELERKAE